MGLKFMADTSTKQKAFLFLEFVVVLAILGILLGVILQLLNQKVFELPQNTRTLLNVSFCNNISPQCLLNPSLETPLPFIELSITPSAP